MRGSTVNNQSVKSNKTLLPLMSFLTLLYTTSIYADNDVKELNNQQGLQTFHINKYTIDAGGNDSSTTPYVLRGSIGQYDVKTLQGGTYTLRSGFWSPSNGLLSDLIFADGFDNQ